MFLLLDQPEVYGLPPDPVVHHPLAPRDVASCRPRRGALRSRRAGAFAGGRNERAQRGLGPSEHPSTHQPIDRRAGARTAVGDEGAAGGASAKWCPTASSPPTTGDRWSRPPHGPPTSPSTSSWAGLPARSSLVGAGAALTDRPSLRRTGRVGALVAISGGMAALVHDLGRPARFANMLRVAKPTSPMSVGTWILSVYGPAAGVAGVGELVRWLVPGPR